MPEVIKHSNAVVEQALEVAPVSDEQLEASAGRIRQPTQGRTMVIINGSCCP